MDHSANSKPNPMLAPYRVLDLTDEKGLFCGKVLGDFGADVVKVERPGGDPARRIGPFYHDTPDPEKSLYWFAFNTNKRGITLDIETATGQQLLKRLVKRADFVIESFPPGHLDKLGLGYSVLSQINPRIIVTSITPFGQTGPRSRYKGADIVAWAIGGPMYLCGDADRPPVQISFPQAYVNAGISAVVGSLIAHYSREITGQGQQVDVSIQESTVWDTCMAHHFWLMQGEIVRRAGPFRAKPGTAGTAQRYTWPCKDGFVAYVVMGGGSGAKTNQALVEWMDSEGMANEYLGTIDWKNFDIAKATQEDHQRIEEPIGKFFKAHTKEELFEGAIRRRVWLYPLHTVRDLLESPQLAARDYWVQLNHPELEDAITYPGPFFRSNETISVARRRAPLIGEHNQEFFKDELGLSHGEITLLEQEGVV